MANNKSIQILRGTSANIVAANSSTTLLAGQPLYNTDKNYLTIGAADGDKLVKKPVACREVTWYLSDHSDDIVAGTTKVGMLEYNDATSRITLNGITVPVEIYSSSTLNMRADTSINVWATDKMDLFAQNNASLVSMVGLNVQAGSNLYLWSSSASVNITGTTGINITASTNNPITLTGKIQQGGVGSYTGALANGFQSVAFGGLRYDASSGGGEARTRTSAEGEQSFAAGGGAHARGRYSVAMGKDTNAYQRSSFAMGAGTQAGMTQAQWNTRYGSGGDDPWGDSYAESYSDALAVGEMTLALGRGAVAVGFNTNAYGHHAVAEGYDTVASGESSHAEGRGTVASGDYSYAGGLSAKATAQYARSSGYGSMAQNTGALTHGVSCYSNGDWQVVFGQYNELVAKAALVIGNGTSTKRDNALVVYTNGTAVGHYDGLSIIGKSNDQLATIGDVRNRTERIIHSVKYISKTQENVPLLSYSDFNEYAAQLNSGEKSNIILSISQAVTGIGQVYHTFPILYASDSTIVFSGANGLYRAYRSIMNSLNVIYDVVVNYPALS